MDAGKVQVYYGDGQGKTSAALGCAIQEVIREGSVIIIEFLKKKDEDEIRYMTRLEPEIRMFRFQKSGKNYEELSEEEQNEEKMNMKNGFAYARKVLLTGECTTLVLDEILGLVDYHIIELEELIHLIQMKSEETSLIMTGRVLPEKLVDYADNVIEIRAKKQS